MNLNDIPSGETVVIDANIILYAAQRASEQCKNLLIRCANDEVQCVLPVHILAEIMHQLMILEARDNGWIKGPNPARQLTEKPEFVKRLVRYDNLVHDIFSIGFQIEPLVQNDFITAIIMQHHYGLLTNDALLVAMARRLHIQALVSADKVFRQVKENLVYAPDDLIT